MKVLQIDSGGMGLDLAMRAQAAGHKIKTYMRHNKNGDRCENGDGIIERVSHWEDWINWADLIITTDNDKYIYQLERFREKGYPIFGPCIDGTQWELNRETGEEVHKKMGIKTIPMTKFKNYDDAIAHVLNNTGRWVAKPIGDGAKELSYVSKSAADMVYMLQKWKKMAAYKGEFVLQEFVGGLEFGCGGWFGPGGFSQWITESWEHKKLMNDDLGVNTGEQGTIIRYTRNSKLADEVLRPCEDMLYGIGYTGYVDVNCIIDSCGRPWPLEWTMRPGWPLFNIQQSLHKGDPVEWMLDLVDGKDTLSVKEDIACGVVISIPDYPYGNITKKENSGYPLFGLKEEDCIKDVHLVDVQWGKAPDMDGDKVKMNVPMYVTAGDYICVVTGLGDTVEESKEACYKTIKKKINVPNSIGYRSDIGCKVQRDLSELHKHGYAKDVRDGR